ncbi:MAG: hypothetical protein CM1200mP27_07890 [Chloroflexota bacterium]|nr:MAG: hypothetical protein CM1200mP27_07890 [Chloroflexota bacterium]
MQFLVTSSGVFSPGYVPDFKGIDSLKEYHATPGWPAEESTWREASGVMGPALPVFN